MYILAVDTSTETGSIALLSEDRVICELNVNCGLNHSQTILSGISDVLRYAGKNVSDCEFFAVTTGPGSFTGLRIGISIVKGLALAASKPVVGVSTLDALAHNLFASTMQIIPFLDAKRGQVYASCYEPGPYGHPEKIIPETVEDPRSFLNKIQSKVIFVGNGTSSYRSIIDEILGDRCVVAPMSFQNIRASVVGFLALKKFKTGEVLDTLSFAPQYIRASGAESADTII
jgi:tRNA threonylcarbamoyladenosine biosynthesis protein TsaB